MPQLSRAHLGGLSQNLTPTWCVIDIGVLAYRELLGFAAPPESLTGEIYLGVDPFFYFERLSSERDAPPLIYNWRIHRIEVETAPRVLSEGMWIYDPDKRKLADVQDTKRGEDFVLHCECLADPPQKRLTHIAAPAAGCISMRASGKSLSGTQAAPTSRQAGKSSMLRSQRTTGAWKRL